MIITSHALIPLPCRSMLIPLMNYWFLTFQINGLAQRYPGLMSLRSVDLSPASWMAVAWSLSLSYQLVYKAYHDKIKKKKMIFFLALSLLLKFLN